MFSLFPKNRIMKICFATLLMCLTFCAFGQEKEPVRKTFGFSMSILLNENAGDYYLRKYGFIHRRCFKGFVLQTEFNRMHQSEPKSILYNLDNGKYLYTGDDYMESNKVSKSQKYFNTQVSLSRGWTNDKVNLYLGLGVSLGQSKASFSSNVSRAEAALDSLGNSVLGYTGYELSASATASYFHVGVVAKASAEFKLVDRVSLLVQFSPEISGAWRYKFENPSYTKAKYSHLVSSGIEVGVHYRL